MFFVVVVVVVVVIFVVVVVAAVVELQNIDILALSASANTTPSRSQHRVVASLPYELCSASLHFAQQKHLKNPTILTKLRSASLNARSELFAPLR